MPLQFRHYKQILEDWLSYIVGHSELSDINPGSVIRTIGEATALEAAQIYVELKAVLNLFSIDKASGDDLDERALDFGFTRRQPQKSSGVVVVGDSNLTVGDTAFSTLAAVLTSGVSTQATIQTADYASFPASGSIVVGRNLGTRELISYTSKTGPNLLNLATLPINSHSIGETAHLSTVGADRTIAISTIVKTGDASSYRFETMVAATLYDGDYQTTSIDAQSMDTGFALNVSVGTITKFESAPFPTATVSNANNFTGGADLELDPAFRLRIKTYLQTLSTSTALAIETAALSVKIDATGQRVVAVKLIEPVSPGLCTLYISDGTAAYAPTTVGRSEEVVIVQSGEAGQLRGKAPNWPLVAGSPTFFGLCTSAHSFCTRGVATSAGPGTLSDTTKSWTINYYAGYFCLTANGQIYEILSNTATQLTLDTTDTPPVGQYAAYDSASPLTEGTDYIVNESTGDIEIDPTGAITSLGQYDCIVANSGAPVGSSAAYSYYDGLLQKVQKVINGDPSDALAYPGVKAAGTRIDITTPSIISVTVSGSISARPGTDETTLREPVRQAILNYINNLSIGDDVIYASLIDAAMNVTGVYDFVLAAPTSNVVITDSQLARSTLANVTVT